MKKIAALSILLAIAAAGCATPEMIAAQQAAQLREDEAHCGSLGFRLGTDNFRLCLLTLQESRKNQEASNAAAAAARLSSH
ncbi:MAG: hypothetical protein ACREDA_11235 [Methylocella sp.]